MEKRLITAIIISIAILIIFQRFQEPVVPEREEHPEEVAKEVEDYEQAYAPEEEKTPDTQEHIRYKEEYEEKSLRRGTLEIGISSAYAGLSRVKMEDKDGSRINLVVKDTPPFPMAFKNVSNWQLNREGDKLQARAEYNGMDIKRTYEIIDNNRVKIINSINNINTEDSVFELSQGWYAGIRGAKNIDEEENISDNSVFLRIDGEVKKGPESGNYEGSIGWAGILNRYFIAIFKDVHESLNTAVVEQTEGSRFGCGRGSGGEYPSIELAGNIVIPAEENYEFTQKLYGGLKNYKELTAMNSDFRDVFSFGIFGFLSRFFLNLLIWLESIFGNYGVAILIMTLLLQVVLFPLSKKSYKAMRAQRELQPKMKKIREKYKSDPQRMNQEIMMLYKKHNINPLGGCLPMLVQLPIFFSLFTMLRSSVELRFERFLWMRDLAGVDDLFSVIPLVREIPLIGNAGPLPFLVGGAMFLQQKAMGASEGPQKAMSYMMPLIFIIVGMNFASGLNLYILINSIFMFISQSTLGKKT